MVPFSVKVPKSLGRAEQEAFDPCGKSDTPADSHVMARDVEFDASHRRKRRFDDGCRWICEKIDMARGLLRSESMTLACLPYLGKRREGRSRGEQSLVPSRGLVHPLWIGALALLALNDHFLKGGDMLPLWLTGKLSDFAGLIVAPIAVAVLLRVRARRGLLAVHVGVGLGFASINLSATLSELFTGALAFVGLPWVNYVDPTDLVALTMLPLSILLLGPAMRRRDDAPVRGLLSKLAVAASIPLMLGSGNSGGANEGGHAPGSGDDGINVGLGHIAVDPSGGYFLSRQDNDLAIGDLDSKEVQVLRTLPTPTKVAFWARNRGRGFFVLGLEDGYSRLASYDFDQEREVWSVSVPSSWGGLKVSEKDGAIVVWSEDWLKVLSHDSGAEVGAFSPTEAIRDVDLRHDTGQLIVTTDTVWTNVQGESMPLTKVLVRDASDAAPICKMEVPNCADELVLTPDGGRAFLAPTFCAHDPVSVLNLTSCTVEKNLPGFGPVALSQNAQTAVAFIDAANEDPFAPPIPEEVKQSDSRFHLMFIDVDTLEYGTLEVGEELPRYAVTPDGRLLVDAQASANNVRILDIEARDLRTVEGAYVLLSDYVLLPNSQFVYGLHGDLLSASSSENAVKTLFEIDIPAARSRTLGLSFSPVSINMVPNGELLLLKDRDSRVHLYDVEDKEVTATIARSAPD